MDIAWDGGSKYEACSQSINSRVRLRKMQILCLRSYLALNQNLDGARLRTCRTGFESLNGIFKAESVGN